MRDLYRAVFRMTNSVVSLGNDEDLASSVNRAAVEHVSTGFLLGSSLGSQEMNTTMGELRFRPCTPYCSQINPQYSHLPMGGLQVQITLTSRCFTCDPPSRVFRTLSQGPCPCPVSSVSARHWAL